MEKKLWLDWREPTSTILMTLATLASAWCVFQSSVWNGRQTFLITAANLKSREAIELQLESNQQHILDALDFIPFSEALIKRDEAALKLHRQRLRPEMKRLVDAWLATHPQENPKAPQTPFAMPEYLAPLKEPSQRRAKEASALMVDARHANSASDTYLLATVLFASVLFFSGTSPKFEHPVLQRFLMVVGALFFVSGVIFAARLPVALREPSDAGGSMLLEETPQAGYP